LEVELSSLVPDEHASVEDYLTKFRLLVAQLKGCRKTKSDEECIFLILSKLKGPYQVFSFAFYSTMDALGSEFKMPSFELFCERLTREQSKLTQLDALSGSNNKALVAHNTKTKHKTRYKKKKDFAPAGEFTSKPQQKTKPFPPYSKSGESSSKTKKKKSNDTCSFCGGLGHVESKCWLKLEALNEAMKQHKISVPKPSSTSKGHALSAQALYASSDSWILDSGASHHMTHSHELLASTSECSIS
jgi:hypothetical protein